MRLKIVLISCLCLILLSSTIVKSQTIQVINQPDTILQKGDPAPYYGVETNPKKYKIYTIDHQEKKEILDQLDNKLKSQPIENTIDSGLSKIEWFLFGAVFALGAQAAFSHH